MSRDVAWVPADSSRTPLDTDLATPEQAQEPGSWWVDLRSVLRSRPFVFFSCVAGSFLIFFFRNPDPYFNPNFFAEDGVSYVGPIYCDGF